MARKRGVSSWIESAMPFVVAVFVGATIVALLSAVINKSIERQSFIEACETMGGVPLIGRHSTRVCFKPEVLNNVH
jgi:hypothetical protein